MRIDLADWSFCTMVAGGSLLFATAVANAGTMQHFDSVSEFDPAYGTGYNYWHIKAGERHDAVGEIGIWVDDGGTLVYNGFGSGTVVANGNGTAWVLTAAHVVDSASFLDIAFPGEEKYVNEDGYWYRSTSYTYYTATDWYVPSSWTGFDDDAFVGNDIALIRLSSEVDGVSPQEMVDSSWTPKFGSDGDEFEAVGFGLTGDGSSGAYAYTGHRRAGANKLEYSMGFDDSILLSDFDPKQGISDSVYEAYRESTEDFPVSMEYQIAGGDSGGPDLIGGKIAGVHSFGWGLDDGEPDSSFLDLAGSINVAVWREWIDAVIDGSVDPADVEEGNAFGPAIIPLASQLNHRQDLENRLGLLMFETYLELANSDDPAERELAELFHPDKMFSADQLLAANPIAQGYLLGTGLTEGQTPLENWNLSIPEPTSLALLLGAGSLAMLRRRSA